MVAENRADDKDLSPMVGIDISSLPMPARAAIIAP
jgi:hypothetical protein